MSPVDDEGFQVRIPAGAAIRCNPVVAALRQRLKDLGRIKPKNIIVAALRKVMHI